MPESRVLYHLKVSRLTPPAYTMTPFAPLANNALQDKHRLALQQALDWLPSIAKPIGIVITGSIVRGNPGPSSDLDIVVLHAQPWRRRVQRWFNGTPAELFFNSEDWLSHCVREEAAQGRPVMAHMLATGWLWMDTDGRLEALIGLSLDVLRQGPNLSPDALLRDRYAAACLVEDALDFDGVDSPDGRRLMALAVEALVQHAYLSRNQFLPRPKERLSKLAVGEPRLAGLLAHALCAPMVEAASALRLASEQVLGTVGFFEWDSGIDGSRPLRND